MGLFTLYDFFSCIVLARAGLVVGPLHSSVCPSVCRNTFGVPSLCNLVTPTVFILLYSNFA